MRYRVTLDTEFQPAPESGVDEDRILAFIEVVLEQLEGLGGVDADAGGTMRTGEVHISVVVDSASRRDAIEEGAKIIQRAVEATGLVAVEDWSRERFIVEPEDAPQPLALVG
jgi:hypothetical protein